MQWQSNTMFVACNLVDLVLGSVDQPLSTDTLYLVAVSALYTSAQQNEYLEDQTVPKLGTLITILPEGFGHTKEDVVRKAISEISQLYL